MSKQEERFRRYEKLAKKAERNKSGQVPPSCARCPYYSPEFKYRSCMYARCPFGRSAKVFRKRPLKRDKFSGSEVVKMKNE